MHHLPSARRGKEEICLHSGLRDQAGAAPCDTADEQRIVQRVAIDARRGDHGNGEHTLNGPARAGVHDVAVSRAPAHEELLGAARDRNRPIAQRNGEGDTRRVERILHADPPCVLPGRDSEAVHRAAARTDQRGADTALTQQTDHAIHRVAFRNAPESSSTPGVSNLIVRSAVFRMTWL